LSYWMIKFLGLYATAPFEQTQSWLAAPINSVGMSAFILMVFYHTGLGLRVVIEDYVGRESCKIISIWLVNLALGMLTLTALLAVFRTLQMG